MGLACVYVDPDGRPVLIDARCIITKKTPRKEKRSDEDLRRRLGEISDAVLGYLRERDPSLVVFESMSWVRNASSSAKIGLAWGAAFAVARSFGLATDVYFPQEVKKGCGLKNDASKEAVQGAVMAAFQGSAFTDWPSKAHIEHAADAAAVILTAARDERWKMLFHVRAGGAGGDR